MDKRQLNRRGLLALISVFLLGVLVGFTTLHLSPSLRRSLWSRARSGPPLERLTKELKLTVDQQEKVRTIMGRRKEQIHELLEKSGEDIRDILDDEQKAALDKMPRRERFFRHRRPRR